MGKMRGSNVRKGDKSWRFVNVDDYGIRTVIADIDENNRALHSSCSKGREQEYDFSAFEPPN
jgi:hypothetical protein